MLGNVRRQNYQTLGNNLTNSAGKSNWPTESCPSFLECRVLARLQSWTKLLKHFVIIFVNCSSEDNTKPRSPFQCLRINSECMPWTENHVANIEKVEKIDINMHQTCSTRVRTRTRVRIRVQFSVLVLVLLALYSYSYSTNFKIRYSYSYSGICTRTRTRGFVIVLILVLEALYSYSYSYSGLIILKFQVCNYMTSLHV